MPGEQLREHERARPGRLPPDALRILRGGRHIVRAVEADEAHREPAALSDEAPSESVSSEVRQIVESIHFER